ncbi:MAG: hypothetical protein IPK82_41850 [Polyangiaceae bacterium]|nr:hypothetical protein [Polyangiaceae bacterium]
MRQLILRGLFVAAALALTACGGPLKYNVPSSRLAPGADAEIVAEVKDETNQTAVNVQAKNLPPPARVNPNGKYYVAWQRKGNQGGWLRLGTVLFDEEKRTGTLAATVPETAFDFEISVEAEEGAQSPSADVVFSQRVSK